MSRELVPFNAATLALDVYAVNAGSERDLKEFLKNKIFAQGAGQKLLTGEVGGRVLRATKDGFGLCALGAGNYQGDLFLIFRGTTEANNKADVFTDARIGVTRSKTGLPVHIGFNQTFNSMLPDIRSFLREANVSGTIHCVGHSLGGAVAALAADWLSKNTSHTAKLYTFGAPRVGLEHFVRSTTNSVSTQNMHRVYHRTDPVPMIALYPYMQAPYGNVGHFVFSAEPLTSGAAHFMKKYVDSVAGKSWLQLSASPDQPYDIEVAIESWLKSKSPVNPASASFWRWVDSALIYVLKKIAMTEILSLQSSIMGLFTFADRVAYILAKGIELADHISIWVELLIRKLMRALHMKVPASKKAMTRGVIRYVLIRVTEKSNENARNAIRKIG